MIWFAGIIAVLIAIIILVWMFQEKLIFFPEKMGKNYSFHFDIPFEERYFNTEDHVRIHGLHFRSKKPKGIIFYFHGNAGSLAGWGDVAYDLVDLGYDVLMIDYRQYGKSTGKITEKGLFHDALYIFNQLKKEYPDGKIIIYGRSIGTGPATWLAAETSPEMLILETPFSSLLSMANRYYPWFPRALIRFQFRNDLYIQSVECPVYIFHGTADEVVPVEEGQKLTEKLKPRDQLYLIPGGHHNDLASFPEYWEQIHEILGN